MRLGFRKTYQAVHQKKRDKRKVVLLVVQTRPNPGETMDLRSRTKALKRRRAKREFRTRLIHVSAAAG